MKMLFGPGRKHLPHTTQFQMLRVDAFLASRIALGYIEGVQSGTQTKVLVTKPGATDHASSARSGIDIPNPRIV